MQRSSVDAMGTRPMLPLLLSMSFPPMLSMLIQSLYNVVDSVFVARIGQDALTAVSLAFPLQNIILAVSVGTGVGLGSVISRSLGASDRRAAENAAAQGLLLSALHALLFFVLSFLVVRPFFAMFTPDEAIRRYGVEYASVVMAFAFGQLFHITIEKILQATGNMIAPMILQAVGAVINIVLDPIFIFGLGPVPAMGVRGAAVATVIGQVAACMLSVGVLLSRHCAIRLHRRSFAPSGLLIGRIYQVGIPSAVMNSLSSVLVMGLNAILSGLSGAAVAVFGVYYKLQTFVYMPSNGLIQGARPIISYNYGANDRARMMQALGCTLALTAGMMAAGTLLFECLPGPILSLFSVEEEAMRMGVTALRVIASSYVISTVGVVFAALFEAMGKGPQSLCVSLLRQFAITLPLSALLSCSMGLMGVWITFPIAESAAAVAAVLLLLHVARRDPVLGGGKGLHVQRKM